MLTTKEEVTVKVQSRAAAAFTGSMSGIRRNLREFASVRERR